MTWRVGGEEKVDSRMKNWPGLDEGSIVRIVRIEVLIEVIIWPVGE